MATITSALAVERSQGLPGRLPYLVEVEIDFADITVSPSAGDVVQALTIPANHMILTAGLEVVEAVTANAADAVMTLGTDTDADEWVTAFDIDAASTGDYAPVAAAATAEVHGTANTLDLTFSATTASAISAGKVRVFALVLNVDGLGSDKGADEVDRDQLA